ncbi:hypothetical protein GE061_009679 [Apolygus lucorum]|uniref:Uncharacterized protein n=1 Tax=Apolygus lucorum TaxID=248454 RepID=A0A8S9Y285_APOLU|nr:hypothetical protein GE061_009679 [Apolygus lucorum]
MTLEGLCYQLLLEHLRKQLYYLENRKFRWEVNGGGEAPLRPHRAPLGLEAIPLARTVSDRSEVRGFRDVPLVPDHAMANSPTLDRSRLRFQFKLDDVNYYGR